MDEPPRHRVLALVQGACVVGMVGDEDTGGDASVTPWIQGVDVVDVPCPNRRDWWDPRLVVE